MIRAGLAFLQLSHSLSHPSLWLPFLLYVYSYVLRGFFWFWEGRSRDGRKRILYSRKGSTKIRNDIFHAFFLT